MTEAADKAAAGGAEVPQPRRKVTALYGGTFDPPHAGHAIVACYTAQWGGVDEVWMSVSPLNPLKAGTRPAPDQARLAMVRAVAARGRGVEATDFEFTLPVPSYTYTTLCALRDAYPDRDFRLLIGSDNWTEFGRWRDPDKIRTEFGIIVYPRPGHPRPEALPEGVAWLDDAPQVVMSSTFVRDAVAAGRDVNHFAPPEVVDMIERLKLYRQ